MVRQITYNLFESLVNSCDQDIIISSVNYSGESAQIIFNPSRESTFPLTAASLRTLVVS